MTFLMVFASCTNRNAIVNKKDLLGSDYRLFQNTPVWELAKSVRDSDVAGIKLNVNKNKQLINTGDEIFGSTLLSMAVYNRNYSSVKTLLELGADPNKTDNYDGTSALMVAAELGAGGRIHPYADSRYLKVLLKYGGNPNAIQKEVIPSHNQNYATPLMFACLSGIFDYVQILVDSGADINYKNKHGFSILYAATVSGNPDIILYLLKKGVDFKLPMYTTAKGEKKYILDALKLNQFEKGSEDYKKQMEIISFLNKNGINK